ncbi:hypothetical protein OH720_23240 [Pseudomonas sp. WJP1]|uniref:hypothetical protein n=1 Tax=Pseudomonas sp. WJP1 TaxID=2986947 RepID=UPI00234B6099|nr:hypothetical protein [Pseudomonas sp. WJP1]WCM49877.1 hypothetical protein OH720_23240 [Pseudomonas sp. WJP1]
MIVIFAHNNSPRGGANIKVDGELTIKKDYYPWVNESFIGKYKKDVSLLSEGQYYFLSYQAPKARQVYFEPILHTAFLVSSVGPKVKEKGNFAGFTYPDGSSEFVARAKPDFLKLQTIRTGRARDCFTVGRYANCPDRRPQLLSDWLPEPGKPGYGRYVVADEWGNTLPSYFYRLIGENDQVFRGLTELNGRTEPLPNNVHPLRKAEFPERVW